MRESSRRRISTPRSARSSPARSRAASAPTRPSSFGIAASPSPTSRSAMPCWRRASGLASGSVCATPEPAMRIAVAGAGAVGGIMARHPAKAGHAPTVLARAATAERIAREGLTLADDERAETVAVKASADAASLGVQDLVFVGFKAQDWCAGLDLVRPLLGRE